MRILVVTADASAAGPLVALARSHAEATLVAVGFPFSGGGADDVDVMHVAALDGVPEWAAVDVIAAVADRDPDVVVGGPSAADRVLLGAIAGATGASLLPRLTALDGQTLTWGAHGGLVEVESRAEGLVVAYLDAALTASGSGDLGTARRVVGVGRGVRTASDLALVAELADALGAELACTRPVAAEGLLPHHRYVGTSGRRITPELYVAVGISGQPQHLVGVRGSGTIVAINSDPSAPILAECDHAIVGDLRDVVPTLVRALRD